MQSDGGVRAGVRETANLACGARGGRPIFSLLLRYRRVAWEKSATSRMMQWSQKCVLLSQYGSQYLTLASSLGYDTFRSYVRDFRGGQFLGPNPLREGFRYRNVYSADFTLSSLYKSERV